LPGLRAWRASRVSSEASQADIEDWGWLGQAGHGGRSSSGLAGGGTSCSGESPANSGMGGVVSVGGVRSKPWGCFIGTAQARAWGLASLGAGAQCRVAWACSGASARVEHVDVRFCSCSSAYRAQIFANLGKIAV
jgi:hypothetical protein